MMKRIFIWKLDLPLVEMKRDFLQENCSRCILLMRKKNDENLKSSKNNSRILVE